MAAKFRVTHQPGKGYHFNLVATNGQVIATSEHYETHRSCLEGIESVRKNAATSRSRTTRPSRAPRPGRRPAR